jgi:hypothetical protein
MNVFIETAGTKLEPSTIEQNAFATLIDGTEWMIVGDSKLNLILWQYSAIGRMISTKYADGQASGGVDINIADIADSGEKWDNHALFDKITDRLSQPTKNANQGGLVGTRYFYDADYLVN